MAFRNFQCGVVVEYLKLPLMNGKTVAAKTVDRYAGSPQVGVGEDLGEWTRNKHGASHL